MAKHYIMTDEADRVLRGFSDDFEQPDASAICVNEKGGSGIVIIRNARA